MRMTTLGMRPLVLSAVDASAARACTEPDAHDTHAWTDGRRAWSCPGRAEQPRRPVFVPLSLAG